MKRRHPIIIEVYRARTGWRWRMLCYRTGRVLAGSGTSHQRLDLCRTAFERATGLPAPGVDAGAGKESGFSIIQPGKREYAFYQ